MQLINPYKPSNYRVCGIARRHIFYGLGARDVRMISMDRVRKVKVGGVTWYEVIKPESGDD